MNAPAGTKRPYTNMHLVNRRRATALGVCAMIALASWSGVANAQAASAETLYRDGRHAAQAKNWELACKLFRESQELEPAPGTLLNLADCEEHLGALLAARAHFETAARTFRPGDKRADYAKERVASIVGRIPKLTVRLSPKAPADAVVERDGLALGSSALGVAASLDPGDHTLVVKVPGQPDSSTTIRLVAGQTREVELTAEVLAHAPKQPAAAGARVALPVPPKADDQASSDSSLRIGAYAAFGVGVVGLAVGTVGGVLTMAAKSDADDNCRATCNPAGMDAQDRGKTWSTVSTIGFIAGGVGLASGIGLLLLSSKAGDVSAQPVAGGGSLRWVGRF